MKIEVVRFIGVAILLVILTICAISWGRLSRDNGMHFDDKAYRLCLNGIVEDTLSGYGEDACLEKYGVEFEN